MMDHVTDSLKFTELDAHDVAGVERMSALASAIVKEHYKALPLAADAVQPDYALVGTNRALWANYNSPEAA